MVAADVLAVALSLLGIPLNAKVLDCCSGDSALAFELSHHFGTVSANDVDQKSRAQTHYDVRRPEFWQTVVHGSYEYVITKPPADVAETIVMQAHEHCSLVALLVSSEKLSQMQGQGLLNHKTPSVSIAMGTSNNWLVWAPHMTYRGVFLDLSESDLELRSRIAPEEWLPHLKERLAFSLSRMYPSSAMGAMNNANNINSVGANGQSTMAAAAAAASSHSMPFPMSSHPFYSQSQFQPPGYAGFAYPENAIEQYHQLSSYAAKRGGGGIGLDGSHMGAYGPTAGIPGLSGVNDPSALSSAHLGANGASNGVKREVASSAGSTGSNSSTTTIATGSLSNTPGAGIGPNGIPNSPFVDFAGLSAYGGARHHPNASAYATQQMLPYYATRGPTGAPAPASPNQAWQFQQAPWASSPGFAHMGMGPNGTHVSGAYAAPQFNPAAILMDMDKLNRPDLLPPNAAAAAAVAAAAAHAANASGASPYGLHKPTAFKASNVPAQNGNGVPSSGSPVPNASVPAAIEDQQLMLSQAEMLYLKGVHAAKQGKALEDAIDKYRSMYSKKDVITKVCKMKYRSAQRKLRIAKHIQRFPEISTMTQRQAERYISEKLRKSRNGTEGRGASADSESD